MQKFFFGKCSFAYKSRFAVEEKNQKQFLGQHFKIFVSPLKNASHTIFIYGNCMVNIFSVHLMYGIVWYWFLLYRIVWLAFSVYGGQPGHSSFNYSVRKLFLFLTTVLKNANSNQMLEQKLKRSCLYGKKRTFHWKSNLWLQEIFSELLLAIWRFQMWVISFNLRSNIFPTLASSRFERDSEKKTVIRGKATWNSLT